MHYILSKNKVTNLILQPAKVDRDGNIIQEPVHIKFEGLIFATDDDKILEKFKKLRNWGSEYALVDKNPNEIVMPTPNITATGMDNPAEQKETRIAALENKVDSIANAVGEMTKFLKSLNKKNKDKDEDEDKDKDKNKKPENTEENK